MSQPPHTVIETRIVPRARDLGGFAVRRALPAPQRQMVGPFIFFDQMGPADFVTAQGIDIRPHPHIGLGTVTYLMQGAFEHRDSLGTRQVIEPGAVNWMLAGRGVTHSERTPDDLRLAGHRLFGVQTWLALPREHENDPPGFEHHGAASLPLITDQGASARLILGHAWGQRAPVTTFGGVFYADVTLAPGARLPLPDDHEDRGLHMLAGDIAIAGDRLETGQMAVFRPGDAITVTAGDQGARLLLLGGDTMTESRYIWWNFVHSDPEAIETAKAAWRKGDWKDGPFTLPPLESDFVPITDDLARTRPRKTS
jgi:redox-sensitive bicupin YhaK (pirin superfamily)